MALDSGRNLISTLPLPVSAHFLSFSLPLNTFSPSGRGQEKSGFLTVCQAPQSLLPLSVFNNALSETLHHQLTFIFAPLGIEPRDLFLLIPLTPSLLHIDCR